MIYFHYFIILGVGLCLGSFLNALEWRLKNKISLLDKRSICPSCTRQLKWYENIPLFSFIFLAGKCSGCKQKISWQYPIVELVTGLLAVFIFYYHNFAIGLALRDFFIVFILLFIFIYDLKYMEVLDRMTLIPASIFFVWTCFLNPSSWSDMLIGGAVGAGFFLLQFVLSKGKWVGGGDIRIGFLMGIVLGWKLFILALWFAYVGGAIISVGLVLLKKKKMKGEVPFGVFLTVATFVVMFWGNDILNWYVGLLK